MKTQIHVSNANISDDGDDNNRAETSTINTYSYAIRINSAHT